MNVHLIRIVRQIFHILFKFVFLIFLVCELRKNEQILYVFPIQPVGKQLSAIVYMLRNQPVNMRSVVRRKLIRKNDLYSPFFKLLYIIGIEPFYFVNIDIIVSQNVVGSFEFEH